MATTKKKVQTKDIIKDITTSLKKEIVASPKDVLKALDLDDIVAKDDKKKDISIGDLLEGIPATKRAGLSAALAESLVNNEILQQNVLVEIGKLIPGNFEPAEVLKPVIPAVKADIKVRPKIPIKPITTVVPVTPIIQRPPIIPRPPINPKPPIIPRPTVKPIPPGPDPVKPLVKPESISRIKPKVLIKPKVDILVKPEIKPKVDILVKPESISRIKPKIIPEINVRGNLELQLEEVQRIRKALPKNATKAEKKAAANAEKQLKNLIKAAKRAEPKATKKAKK
ncbi:hypothetical protein [Fibrobacter sp. UWB3]|uniref:hypothetical protein n=1 Tax=Fibrobacter sp. UWB3 TaxID=1964357 RepID=UPI000B526E03|nr:hypothetical protein [Fibrobacter sp. UWB3]OWV18068.1 hypothetical protein B7991_10545 [Fibrobacter sp. UWB3]